MNDTTSRSSVALRTLGWAAGAIAIAVLILGAIRVARGRSAQGDVMLLCQSLQKAGVVTRCALQTSPIVYGVQAEQVVRFEVRSQGLRAYSGTLARLRDPERVQQLLRFSAEADTKSARRTAAAAEIGSRGRVSGTSVMAALAPIQIANLGRCIVADLKPVYGGPQQAAAGQVEAIRARVRQ
jgi:hypothetical protein